MLLILGIVLQRFYMVKPCSKEMKCDVEVSLLVSSENFEIISPNDTKLRVAS